MKIAPMGTETGASFMMVVSYWEQACALLNYGLLHEDLFFETSGEFFGVWDRVKPTMAEGRKCSPIRYSSRIWRKPRTASKRGRKPALPAQSRLMRKMGEQMRAQFASAAKA